MAENSCLLLLDLMAGLVDRFPEPSLKAAWNDARDAAAAAGIPVVFVRVAFRPGYPEIATRNKLFGQFPAAGVLAELDVSTAIHPAVSPRPGEVVVTKRRVSSFTGSDLDVILRAQGTETVVLAGLVTSGVVLSTLVEAVDRDFRIVVLSDGCADSDAELHRALLDRYFPTRGRVMTTAEWTAEIAAT